MVLMKLTIPFRRRFLDVNRGVAVHFEFCKLIVLNVPIFIALHRYNKKPHQDKQGVLFVRCHGNNSPQYVVTDPCKRKESPKNENGIQIEAVLFLDAKMRQPRPWYVRYKSGIIYTLN